MKRIILAVISVMAIQGAFNQTADTLSLEACFKIAGERSPLNRQKNLSAEAWANKNKNLTSNWYPSLGFNAQAMYYSETVHFSDLVGNLPASVEPLPLDQYKIWADINQQLYDGGAVKARKAIEKASYEADLQQVETDILVLKQQVNQTYFSMLAAKVNTSVLQVSFEELQEKKKVVKAGVDNGLVLSENMMALEAEELRLQQKLLELKLNQDQLLKVLSILMDSTLADNLVIHEPAEPQVLDESITRPEYVLLDKQKEQLQASQKLVSSTDLPKFFAFSQVAYGRPGYNFLSREFHPYYSVGMGMKWNFMNYGDNRRQKKILDIQKDIVDIKRETFDDQLSILLQTEKTNQEKYDELLNQDEAILKLRKAIAATSLNKLTNGIITSTDYLTDLNAEILARLQYENHKLLKIQAFYNYMLLQGKL
jgi:outer membrane protein TolC